MKQIINRLNLFASQFFKSMQFMIVVVAVFVVSNNQTFQTFSEVMLFIATLLIASALSGVLYMIFFNQYMGQKVKEEMNK